MLAKVNFSLIATNKNFNLNFFVPIVNVCPLDEL